MFPKSESRKNKCGWHTSRAICSAMSVLKFRCASRKWDKIQPGNLERLSWRLYLHKIASLWERNTFLHIKLSSNKIRSKISTWYFSLHAHMRIPLCQCVCGKLSNKWLPVENINGFIQFKLHTFCQQISSFRNQPLTGSLGPHIEQLVSDRQNPFD